jgi:phage-related protein
MILLRIKVATDICRIFYFHHKNRLYVLTSGYVKKTEKTDEQEIERALKIRDNFLTLIRYWGASP